MSLKTDYNLQTAMNSVYDLGAALIVSTPTAAYTKLSSDLAVAAAAGKKEFTVNVNHNADNTNLELKGTYWQTYRAGVISSLANEDIYDYEVSVSLNTTTTGVATIDLIFTF